MGIDNDVGGFEDGEGVRGKTRQIILEGLNRIKSVTANGLSIFVVLNTTSHASIKTNS